MFSIMIPIGIRIAHKTQHCNYSKTFYTKQLLKFRAFSITSLLFYSAITK